MTLRYGDYSFIIPKNKELGINEDIYFDKYICIERKANLEEISSNFTHNRDRFKREFEKGKGSIRLLIEDSSYKDICDHKYNTKFPVNSFLASLHSFAEEYGTPFVFCDKSCSGKYIYNTFYYYLRNKLKNNK